MISIIALSLAQDGAAPAAKPALVVQQVKEIPNLHPLAYAPGPSGSKFAVTLEDKTVRIMDAGTRETLKTFTGHPQPAYAIAWTRDGRLLATGDESARIMVWGVDSGQKLSEWRTHTKGIQSLSFNYPGSLLLSTGKDDAVKEWDIHQGKDVKTILGKGANFYSATFKGKSNDFGVGILGYGARLYSGAGDVLGFFTGHNNQGVFDIAFNSAGTRAVTAGRDGTGIVWDTTTRQKIGSLKGDTDQLFHAAFTPNGKWVATSSVDRTVRIWNAYNQQLLAVIENQSAVGSPICFTPDGKYLLTAGVDDGMQIFSLSPPQAGTPEKVTPVKKNSKKSTSKKSTKKTVRRKH